MIEVKVFHAISLMYAARIVLMPQCEQFKIGQHSKTGKAVCISYLSRLLIRVICLQYASPPHCYINYKPQ